ncbi:unnamed protein product [Mesocestoides corti]|uniref:Uncharacterized protein n=1 Tax=Mesocestoides corti TaxID=53468 RepID=A0A0R3U7R2_MESCO|nr:unnamed protein product [Mesocestoides corti]
MITRVSPLDRIHFVKVTSVAGLCNAAASAYMCTWMEGGGGGGGGSGGGDGRTSRCAKSFRPRSLVPPGHRHINPCDRWFVVLEVKEDLHISGFQDSMETARTIIFFDIPTVPSTQRKPPAYISLKFSRAQSNASEDSIRISHLNCAFLDTETPSDIIPSCPHLKMSHFNKHQLFKAWDPIVQVLLLPDNARTA